MSTVDETTRNHTRRGVAWDMFASRYPEYLAASHLDDARAAELRRLDETRHVYLDYTGSGLYPASLPVRHAERLTTGIYGNPHSFNPASMAATRLVDETFGRQTAQLNEVLANNSQMMHQTAEQVGAQSKEAIGILTSQTGNLREVSKGLLDQIHGLTQRFENQGQAILTAAKALDSSNAKIDSILEGRHQAIISLLHTVNTKAQELDGMMR